MWKKILGYICSALSVLFFTFSFLVAFYGGIRLLGFLLYFSIALIALIVGIISFQWSGNGIVGRLYALTFTIMMAVPVLFAYSFILSITPYFPYTGLAIYVLTAITLSCIYIGLIKLSSKPSKQ